MGAMPAYLVRLTGPLLAGLVLVSAPPGRVAATAPGAASSPTAAPGSVASGPAAPATAVASAPVAPDPVVTAAPVAGPTAASPVHPLRATVPAFGGALELEVRDLSREPANAAIQAAVVEVGEIERLTDPGRPDGELALLNAAAGKGPRHVDPRLFSTLVRARDFCLWSEGKEGPLAGALHGLWGRGTGASLPAAPPPNQLNQAIAAADCKNLILDSQKQTAALAAGSALDLVDFSTGLAVDRAIEVLRQHGAANAFVQIREVRRGIGAGRNGRGWLIDLPAIGGLKEPLGRIFLRDQSLAAALRDVRPLDVGGQLFSHYINQRTGQPADEGVFAIFAVTELATDAQALAATMTITGTQEGEMLTGSIRPRPSLLWLMGSGTGVPLLVEYRWTEVPKR
jgi:thiamine biosynthesis lipoprotein